MRVSWGSVVLPVMVAFFLLSGCTDVTTTQTADTATKAIVQSLPPDLSKTVGQIALELPKGKVSFTAAPDFAAAITLSVPAEYSTELADTSVVWEIIDGSIQPMLKMPEGLDRELVHWDVHVNYPADQLPSKIALAIREGEVMLAGIRGELDIVIGEGSCRLEQAVLEGNSRVSAGGSLTVDLAELRPGVQRLEAGFGVLELWLPAEAGVRIVARADLGAILSDLDFSYLETSEDTGVGSALVGWLNAGGSELQLQIASGNISLFPR